MLNIAVNFAKRPAADCRRYTSKGFRRCLSSFEKENVLIQISVKGVIYECACELVNKIADTLGYRKEDVLFSLIKGTAPTYDTGTQCYTDWICIPRDVAYFSGGSTEYGSSVRAEVRKAARKVKCDYGSLAASGLL